MVDFIIDMDSPQLRDGLIQVSWSYYSRSVSVVDEQLFMSHRKRGKRSQYYSRFLECALLACATRIRTSQAMKPLGRSYAERAKNDLVYELENPTIATLQGLLLLSEFEATSARDRIGWTYNGIACRMLFDLGLHEDCPNMVQNGILDEADAKIRNQLFLSSFVHDRLWALYLGRPCCIPLVSIQPRRMSSDMDQLPPTLLHWVNLCSYIAELTDTLNGFGSVIDEGTAQRLLDLGSRIDDAHKSLPPGFSSDNISGLFETAYGLNMQFCGIQIVLHRAIIKALCGHDGLNAQSDQIERSRCIMEENAVVICQLVLAYRGIFGVENFITVMLDNMYIAVGTLIAHVLQPPNHGRSTVGDPERHLRIVCETFDALQKHYTVAEKMRRTLSMVTDNTVLAGTFSSNTLPDGSRRNHTTVSLPYPNPILPAPNGSWGSMEALLNDDFLLGHSSLFGETFNPDHSLGDAEIMQNNGLGMMS